MSTVLQIIAEFFLDIWLWIRGKENSTARRNLPGEPAPENKNRPWWWIVTLLFVGFVVWLPSRL